jgi:hypothetical protein
MLLIISAIVVLINLRISFRGIAILAKRIIISILGNLNKY